VPGDVVQVAMVRAPCLALGYSPTGSGDRADKREGMGTGFRAVARAGFLYTQLAKMCELVKDINFHHL